MEARAGRARLPEGTGRWRLRFERGGKRDLGVVELGNRAAGLGIGDSLVEGRLAGAGHFGLELQVALGDREAFANLFQADLASGFQTLGDQIRLAQLRGERHGKAARVGRR